MVQNLGGRQAVITHLQGKAHDHCSIMVVSAAIPVFINLP
jgi:hypothetical protein